MIFIIEPMCKGLSHSPINSAFITIVKSAFPDEKIIFFADKSHCSEVKLLLPERNAEVEFATITHPQRSQQGLFNIIEEVKLYVELLSRVDMSKCSHLIITAANAANLIALKIVLIFRKIKTKVVVVLHSPLAELAIKRPLNAVKRCTDFKSALMTLNGLCEIQYIVLENIVKRNMDRLLPELSTKTHTIEHPVSLDCLPASRLHADNVVRFAFVGVTTREKGFDTYVRLAIEVKLKYSSLAEFYILGSVAANIAVDLSGNIFSNTVSTQKLPRSEMLRLAENIDYVCLFYDAKHYNLCASGALLDAISWEKPIIAKNIPLFCDLFERYGEIGYLYEDDHELQSVINNLLHEKEVTKYLGFIENLRKIKQERYPVNLSHRYKEIFSQL